MPDMVHRFVLTMTNFTQSILQKYVFSAVYPLSEFGFALEATRRTLLYGRIVVPDKGVHLVSTTLAHQSFVGGCSEEFILVVLKVAGFVVLFSHAGSHSVAQIPGQRVPPRQPLIAWARVVTGF